MSTFLGPTLRKKQRALLVLSAVAAVLIVFGLVKPAPRFPYLGTGSSPNRLPKTPQTPQGDVDLLLARPTFVPFLYEPWDGRDAAKGLGHTCNAYWAQLQTSGFSVDSDFQFEPRIYDKHKWMIKAKKELRRKLHKLTGVRFGAEHVKQLEEQFLSDTHTVNVLEQTFVHHTAHMRVLGQCLFGPAGPHINTDDDASHKLLASLLPWWNGQNLVDAASGLHGSGIVVALMPDSPAGLQVDRVARLIRVLRVQGNKLPVHVVYAGQNPVRNSHQAFLIDLATSENTIVLPSREEGVEHTSKDHTYSPFKVLFADMSEHVAEGTKIDCNLMVSLAGIFSPFEDTILLNSQVIPLATNLEAYFADEGYKAQGMLYFKNKPSLDNKVEPFPMGFFEANELVNEYARVNGMEEEFFNLRYPKDLHTSWVTTLGFRNLLDPSLMVLNKRKTLPGLLMSSILPLHQVLLPKYALGSKLNPDLMWLGQELAGNCDYVHFNRNFASIAGVVTPPQNRPPGSQASEICSSSWSQIESETGQLLYVTTHQLENRVMSSFVQSSRAKLTVFAGDAPESDDTESSPGGDDSLAVETVDKNILYIKSAIQPIARPKPIVNNDREPAASCLTVLDFGSVTDYWCAYDIVGNRDLPNKGTVYHFEPQTSQTYLFYLDTWLQDPEFVPQRV